MTKRSTFSFVTRIALLTWLLVGGCSREVPSAWTSDSPASHDSHAAPTQDVTLSLDSDPPLPGETATGWIGLEQPSAAPDHAEHAGHGGHGEPAKSEPEPKPEPRKPADKPKP